MHLELLPATQGEKGPDHQDAPGAQVQAGPRPDLAPGVALDEVV